VIWWQDLALVGGCVLILLITVAGLAAVEKWLDRRHCPQCQRTWHRDETPNRRGAAR
jgi:hypothetical protein